MRKLDTYEVAYLRGGPDGVLAAAVAALTHRGDLEVRDDGSVFAPAGPVISAHRIERTVLAAASRPSLVPDLLSDSAVAVEVEQIRLVLMADGYIAERPGRLRRRRRTRSGERRLRFERRRHEALRTAAGVGYAGNPADAALAVALFPPAGKRGWFDNGPHGYAFGCGGGFAGGFGSCDAGSGGAGCGGSGCGGGGGCGSC
jgi:hypothetical protein